MKEHAMCKVSCDGQIRKPVWEKMAKLANRPNDYDPPVATTLKEVFERHREGLPEFLTFLTRLKFDGNGTVSEKTTLAALKDNIMSATDTYAAEVLGKSLPAIRHARAYMASARP
jgi:hypothetical protein